MAGRDPKYRADCIEWFHDRARETEKIQFSGPRAVFAAIEQAAERAGRSFNDQLLYVLRVCEGRQALDFSDTRSLSKWRVLIGQLEMQLNEGEAWVPCGLIFPKAEVTA